MTQVGNSTELVIVDLNGENRIDSRLVAESLGIKHKAFSETLRAVVQSLDPVEPSGSQREQHKQGINLSDHRYISQLTPVPYTCRPIGTSRGFKISIHVA